MKIRQAVFPVAGSGTRFLPATKAVPKEMLPILNKPLLQYAIEEAREAGVETFIFVHSRGKSIIEDHVDAAPALERELREANRADKAAMADMLKEASIPAGDAVFIRQPAPLGLGHAVWCARRFVCADHFAVILPDDFILARTGCLGRMVEAWEGSQGGRGAMLAAMRVEREQTRRYGVFDVERMEGPLARARDLVEKPDPDSAPSTLAVVGRYILPRRVMDLLGVQKPGAGGEIQLTDAIRRLIGEGAPVSGFAFAGERFDCGALEGFVKANIAAALETPGLREEIIAFLRTRLPERAQRAAA